MSNLNEEFNPKRTTLKDYMLYLIEQVDELKKDQQDTQNKVTRLEIDMERRNTLSEEKEKQNKGLWVVIGAIGGIIVFLIEKLFNHFIK
jgi:hypothetical protein